MYFESVSMSSAKEKTFSTLHDRNIEIQVQCVNMSSANENALIEHVHGILPERTEPGGVGNVRSALVITASAAPAPAGEGGRKGTWNSFAEGVRHIATDKEINFVQKSAHSACYFYPLHIKENRVLNTFHIQ